MHDRERFIRQFTEPLIPRNRADVARENKQRTSGPVVELSVARRHQLFFEAFPELKRSAAAEAAGRFMLEVLDRACEVDPESRKRFDADPQAFFALLRDTIMAARRDTPPDEPA